MNPEGNAKTSAIISYITIVGTIIAYFMNMEEKNEFASFHIRQAFGINITFSNRGWAKLMVVMSCSPSIHSGLNPSLIPTFLQRQE